MDALKVGGSWIDIFWIAFAVALTVFVWFKFGKSIRLFISEVSTELRKCSWPWDENKTGFSKYRELFDSTVVVVVSTILLSAIVTCSDFILLKVIGFVTRLH